MKYPSTAEALFLLTQTKFKHFTERDWEAFLGCESENPLIGYNEDYTLVLDGETLNIVRAGDVYGGKLYLLSEI